MHIEYGYGSGMIQAIMNIVEVLKLYTWAILYRKERIIFNERKE